jgi:tetratricopeptide (TPR) repeat protein
MAVVGVSILAVAVALVYRKDQASVDNRRKRGIRARDRATLLREAGRRLEQNPRDPDALQTLAELYFQEQDYENARRYYQVLVEMCGSTPDLDEFEIMLRHAGCALRMNDFESAHRSLTIARTLNESSFEVNYQLGYLEFMQKNYAKAVAYLQKAGALDPEHVEIHRYLGQTLFRLRRYGEALPCLKRTLEYDPDDKESLFILGQTCFFLKQQEAALQIFSSLRADPTYGARATLFSGTIHLNTHSYQKAVADLQIGLRHPDTPVEVALELKYRLAAAHLALREVRSAIRLWREIREIQPDFRDVEENLRQYQELSANQSLQSFLLGARSEFVTLCRRIASLYFPRSQTRLVDVHIPQGEHIDILALVKVAQWEEHVLFRFVRSEGQVGELMLRELYTRLKELRAGRGVCLTAGEYTDSAKAFSEARPIDLVGKDDLIRLFRRLSGKTTPASE